MFNQVVMNEKRYLDDILTLAMCRISKLSSRRQRLDPKRWCVLLRCGFKFCKPLHTYHQSIAIGGEHEMCKLTILLSQGVLQYQFLTIINTSEYEDHSYAFLVSAPCRKRSIYCYNCASIKMKYSDMFLTYVRITYLRKNLSIEANFGELFFRIVIQGKVAAFKKLRW